MARLEVNGQTISEPQQIAAVMCENGLLYENWGLREGSIKEDSDVLTAYKAQIEALNEARGYVTADLIALRPTTPNLDVICAKFDKEHHHVDDEVRFVVEGAGVFELESGVTSGKWLKFTAEPGDLIVIPAYCRHLFYLTESKTIRCIRLFKDQSGWEAIYEKLG